MIPLTPRTAIEMNQTAVRGPKIAPIPAVPCRCTANTAEMMMTAIGTTHCCSAGAAILRPSTAPSTEMAGVMMPSP